MIAKNNIKIHIKSSFKLAHRAHRLLLLMRIYLDLPPRATNPLKRSRFLAFKMSTFSPCFADLILRQIVGFRYGNPWIHLTNLEYHHKSVY